MEFSPVYLFTSIIILLTVILILKKNHQQSNKRTASKQPLPGPWKLPIIGNLHQLIGHDPHRRLAQLAQKYGPDLMQVQLGELSVIVVSSPEAAKQVLKTHDLAFASRPGDLLAPNIIYDGCKNIALAPYGEYWRQMRKIAVLELLSTKRVLSFRRIREEEVKGFVDRIQLAGRAGEVVDLSEMVGELTSSVTSRAAFGKVQELSDEFMIVVHDISDAVSGFKVSDLYPSLKFLPTLTGFRAKLERMRRASDSILDKIIDEHQSKRGRRRGAKIDEEDDNDDMMDVLLDIQENHSLSVPVTVEVIKAVTLELFLAGIDTSLTAILWTMSEMIKNPKVMQIAQQEVREVFSDIGNVEEASLHKLNYLDMVIAEALRLHPPIPLLVPRETREDVKFDDGYEVPMNARVFVNAWTINRDLRHWTDADSFHPERFVDGSADFKGTDFHFIPFGAGRRICPGITFGLAIVKLTLANLLFHFNWKLPGGVKLENIDMTESFGVILVRKYPLRLVPSPYIDNDEK
ncbi:Cytochrome P450 71D8 [Linum grandiflorum]